MPTQPTEPAEPDGSAAANSTSPAVPAVRLAVRLAGSTGVPGPAFAPRREAQPGLPPAAVPGPAQTVSVAETGTSQEEPKRTAPNTQEPAPAQTAPLRPVGQEAPPIWSGPEGGALRGPPPGADDDEKRVAEGPPSRGRGKPAMAAAALGALVIVVPFALAMSSGRTATIHVQAPAGATGPTAPATNALPTQGATASSGAPSTAATVRSAPTTKPAAADSSSATATSAATSAGPATAASAVLQLGEKAAGRHICYRVYVTGLGWQAPACDGAQAGVIGKTIQALDIAMHGTSGGAANALMAKTGWEYSVWPSEPDDQDIMVGNPGGGLPVIGNTVSVGSGSVCVDDYVSDNVGWQETKCTTPGNWTFAGTVNTTTLLVEAVRFTV